MCCQNSRTTCEGTSQCRHFEDPMNNHGLTIVMQWPTIGCFCAKSWQSLLTDLNMHDLIYGQISMNFASYEKLLIWERGWKGMSNGIPNRTILPPTNIMTWHAAELLPLHDASICASSCQCVWGICNAEVGDPLIHCFHLTQWDCVEWMLGDRYSLRSWVRGAKPVDERIQYRRVHSTQQLQHYWWPIYGATLSHAFVQSAVMFPHRYTVKRPEE